MSNNIVEKIKKLLTLAADKGASEDEAATALRMAQGLMLKHQISEEQVAASGASKAQVKALHKRRPLQMHELQLLGAAAYLFGCTCLVYDKGKMGYALFGRQDNIDAAEETLLWLCSQVECLYKSDLQKGLTKTMRAEFRRTYKWAASCRVHTRARELVDNPVSVARDIGSTALVVRDHYKHLLDEARSIMPEAKSMHIKGSYGSGTQQGAQAGDKVRLRKEIQ